jgi:hypothetical protein
MHDRARAVVAIDPNENNPYRSPRVSTDVDSLETAANNVAPKQRTHWRSIPTGLLVAFGGVMFSFGLAAIVLGVYLVLTSTIEPLTNKHDFHTVLFALWGGAMAANGSLLLFAAYDIWKYRWWQGVLAATLGLTIHLSTIPILMAVGIIK